MVVFVSVFSGKRLCFDQAGVVCGGRFDLEPSRTDRISPSFLRTGSGRSAAEQREAGCYWDQVPDVCFACSIASLIPLAPVPFFSCEAFDFVSCMVRSLAGRASLRDSGCV